MTGLKLRFTALVLAVLLLAPMAAGLLGAAHVCDGQDCTVCAAIRRSAWGFFAVIGLAVGIMLRENCVAYCPANRKSILLLTPVRMRVRIND